MVDIEDEALSEVIKILETLDQCVAIMGHLERALQNRDVIGQGKGILVAQQGCTPDEAFDILRRASQRENVKLRDIAAKLVENMVRDESGQSVRST